MAWRWTHRLYKNEKQWLEIRSGSILLILSTDWSIIHSTSNGANNVRVLVLLSDDLRELNCSHCSGSQNASSSQLAVQMSLFKGITTFRTPFNCQSCIYVGAKFNHHCARWCPSASLCQAINRLTADYKVRGSVKWYWRHQGITWTNVD